MIQDATAMLASVRESDESVSRVRTLIVDEHDSGCRLMRSLLAAVADVEVVAEARSAAEARKKIAELHPDLVLMDVKFQTGDGIELLRDLESPPHAIFLTAHPEFAVSAFEVGAVDYLVKPVGQQRFVEGVLRAKRRIAERRIADLALHIAGAAATMNERSRVIPAAPAPRYPSQLTIRVRRRMFWLDVADIIWIQGQSQYSRLHAKSGEFLLSRSLASLECELDPQRFFRIHRSAIVNASHVEEIRSSGDGRYNIYVRGGPVLPMGRSRRELLGMLLKGVASRHD